MEVACVFCYLLTHPVLLCCALFASLFVKNVQLKLRIPVVLCFTNKTLPNIWLLATVFSLKSSCSVV